MKNPIWWHSRFAEATQFVCLIWMKGGAAAIPDDQKGEDGEVNVTGSAEKSANQSAGPQASEPRQTVVSAPLTENREVSDPTVAMLADSLIGGATESVEPLGGDANHALSPKGCGPAQIERYGTEPKSEGKWVPWEGGTGGE
jgi:hypothetical protein